MKTLLLPCAFVTCLISANAEDWPAWGGKNPSRNMFSPAKGVTWEFNPGKFKQNSEEIDPATTKNVKWIAKLGSQTYGNPVIAGGKVFVGTNNASARDSRFKDDKSVLLAFDEKTGAFLWQFTVPKLASGKVNDWEYLGFLSAPYVEGDRMYAVTSRCEVVCLDVNGQANGNDGEFQDEGQYMPGPGKPKVEVTKTDADIIWRYDMMDELGVFPHNASNSSPLVLDDKVIVCTSNGQDWTHVNIPSPKSPSFIMLDKKTGALVAEDDAAMGSRIFHGQWTSPSAAKIGDKWQIYFGGGDGLLYAFDPTPVKEDDTDFMKKVWWLDAVPEEYKKDKNGKPWKYPAPEGPSEIIATPVFYKGNVYICSGQDPEHGEGVGRIMCVDPTKTGDITKTGIIWDFKGINRSISTVAIDPATDLLFAADYSGFVYCFDAIKGTLHWKHDMQAHMWASPLVVDGKVFIGDEDGDLLIFEVSKEKKILSEVAMSAPVFGTAVVANDTLYITTQTHLYVIGKTSSAPSEAEKKKD